MIGPALIGHFAAALGAASGWLAGVSPAATSGLVAAIWQGMLLSLMVALGLRLLPKTPAGVRFAIWFGVFAIVAVLPVVALLSRGGVARADGRAAWLTLDARWCLVVAGAWVMASLVRAVTLLLAVFRVRALWKRAVPMELAGVGFVHPTHRDEAAMNGAHERMGASSSNLRGEMWGARRALLCVSDEVDRPTVIGFFSPKILIPDWLVEKLTPSELEQVVLHETGHLGRADDWINLLQKIALVVFPLNPALEWIERRLCFERELACDERVLKTTNAPKAYAACLTTLAENRLQRKGLALALGVLGRESELGRRVGRILRRSGSMRPLHGKLVLGGAMLGLLTAAAGLEHCPQVVGFAQEGAMAASAPEPVLSRAGLQGYGYQAVIFRKDSSLQNNNLQIKAKVMHDENRVCAVSASRSVERHEDVSQRVDRERVASAYGVHTVSLRSTSTKAIAGDGSVADGETTDPNAQAGRVVRWVVVTSWQGEDGSKMVLTTAQSVDGKVVRSQGAGNVQTPSDPGSDSDQVHPYAAVPVRGGWLVFQL